MPELVCANCEKPFYSKHSVAKYCNSRCAALGNRSYTFVQGKKSSQRVGDEQLIELLVQLGQQLGRTPSKKDVDSHIHIRGASSRTYGDRFGSFTQAAVLAGFEPNESLAFKIMLKERQFVRFKLRYRVLQRDGFRCQYCGGTPQQGYVLHVDHKIPRSKGGATVESNLITACSICNLGKGDDL